MGRGGGDTFMSAAVVAEGGRVAIFAKALGPACSQGPLHREGGVSGCLTN